MDYTTIVVAVIAAVPGTVAAYASLHNQRMLRTPSKTSIGTQVEAAHQTSIANNYRLQALGSEFGVVMPAAAEAQEAHAEALNTDVLSRRKQHDA